MVCAPADRLARTGALLAASFSTLAQCHELPGAMSFQFIQLPPSIRTQNESSLSVGAMVRPQNLYVPAAVTENGITVEPLEGADDWLLLPDATVTYWPPEALASLCTCIGAVTVPLSASAV